jgi:hypothetical protein
MVKDVIFEMYRPEYVEARKRLVIGVPTALLLTYFGTAGWLTYQNSILFTQALLSPIPIVLALNSIVTVAALVAYSLYQDIKKSEVLKCQVGHIIPDGMKYEEMVEAIDKRLARGAIAGLVVSYFGVAGLMSLGNNVTFVQALLSPTAMVLSLTGAVITGACAVAHLFLDEYKGVVDKAREFF